MGRKKKERLESVLYTIPAIVLVCVVFYIPFVMAANKQQLKNAEAE